MISKATGSRYEDELKPQIEAAKRLRRDLTEAKKCDMDVSEVEHKTINELRRYQHPPECIYDVIKAACMLLGENESSLKVSSSIVRSHK